MLAFLLNSTQLKQINHTYYLKKLPLERQLLLQSYKFEADYLASLAGDMLLEYGINKLYGITEIPLISLGEHGKPFFENSNIHFNISHSGKYTLCAIGNTPVGIDIQEINFFDEQQIMSIVNHFFSSSEKKLINESNCPVDLFFTLVSQRKLCQIHRYWFDCPFRLLFFFPKKRFTFCRVLFKWSKLFISIFLYFLNR